MKRKVQSERERAVDSSSERAVKSNSAGSKSATDTTAAGDSRRPASASLFRSQGRSQNSKPNRSVNLNTVDVVKGRESITDLRRKERDESELKESDLKADMGLLNPYSSTLPPNNLGYDAKTVLLHSRPLTPSRTKGWAGLRSGRYSNDNNSSNNNNSSNSNSNTRVSATVVPKKTNEDDEEFYLLPSTQFTPLPPSGQISDFRYLILDIWNLKHAQK